MNKVTMRKDQVRNGLEALYGYWHKGDSERHLLNLAFAEVMTLMDRGVTVIHHGGLGLELTITGDRPQEATGMLFKIKTTRDRALQSLRDEYDYQDLTAERRHYVDIAFHDIINQIDNGAKIVINEPLAVEVTIAD